MAAPCSDAPRITAGLVMFDSVEERRPEVVHPPVAQLADVGERGPQSVNRERERDRMEVAVAEHAGRSRRHDERVVIHRREFQLDGRRGAASTNSR